MANYIYYENAQIPIFSAMIVLLWTIVSVRIWVYLKTFCGWRSFRGASTIAITITAFLCTVYYGLLLAIYFMNNDMLKVREQPRPDEPYPAGGYEFRDPANYSDAEVDKFIEQMDRIIKVCIRSTTTNGIYSKDANIIISTTAHLLCSHDPYHWPLVD